MIFRNFDYKKIKDIFYKVLEKKYTAFDYDLLYFELNKIYLINRCKPRFQLKNNCIKFVFKNKRINDFFIIKFEKDFSFKDRFFLSDFLLSIFIFN